MSFEPDPPPVADSSLERIAEALEQIAGVLEFRFGQDCECTSETLIEQAQNMVLSVADKFDSGRLAGCRHGRSQ